MACKKKTGKGKKGKQAGLPYRWETGGNDRENEHMDSAFDYGIKSYGKELYS